MRQLFGAKLNRKGLKDKGSAMIVAIIVSMVVFVFALSLLLVAYSLFSSSTRRITQNQCRELTKTISIELEKELTETSYSSFAEQRQALDDGRDMLWQYIRYNVCQGSWPYYEGDDKVGNDEKSAYRYFNLDVTGGDSSSYAAMADDISVCIYWENDGSYISSKDDTVLCVKVTCSKGEQSSTMLTKYILSCVNYDGDTSSTDSGNESVNPSDNLIETSEHWVWSFLERE